MFIVELTYALSLIQLFFMSEIIDSAFHSGTVIPRYTVHLCVSAPERNLSNASICCVVFQLRSIAFILSLLFVYVFMAHSGEYTLPTLSAFQGSFINPPLLRITD